MTSLLRTKNGRFVKGDITLKNRAIERNKLLKG